MNIWQIRNCLMDRFGSNAGSRYIAELLIHARSTMSMALIEYAAKTVSSLEKFVYYLQINSREKKQLELFS